MALTPAASRIVLRITSSLNMDIEKSSDRFGDHGDFGHRADAHVAAGKALDAWRDKDEPRRGLGEDVGGLVEGPILDAWPGRRVIFQKLPKMPARDRALPHQGVHRGGENEGLVKVPGTRDACQEGVGEAKGDFGQGIGVKGGDHEEIGPLAKLDMKHKVAALIQRSAPFIGVSEEWSSMGGPKDFRLLGNERRGIEKAQRRLGRDDPNRVTKFDEGLVKFGGPNRGHGAGHS